jgi:hypothetical protein
LSEEELSAMKKSGVLDDDENRASVLLGIILGSNRKSINNVYNELKESDIVKK